MPIIRLETILAVAPDVAFDLARDLSIHCRTMSGTRERIVEGPRGLIGSGETVTFEAVHFGVRQRLTASVVEFDPPRRFVDEMRKGAFHSLRHAQEFEPLESGTLMRDVIEYVAPLGMVGRLADALFLRRYMTHLITRRNHELARIAAERNALD